MAAEEHLIFGPTVEALFVRALKGKLPADLVKQIAALGLELHQPIRPAYPRKVVNDAIFLTARALYPDKPVSDAFYEIGKHVTPGQKATLLGSAILKVVAIVGPHRTLGRLARTFRTTNNYMTVKLEQTGEREYDLVLEPSNDYPSYMQAVIEDMLTLAGAKNLVVQVVSHDKTTARCTYRITWAA